MNDKKTFENCLARIDEIAGILSAGTADLEQSLALYQEANDLLAEAKKALAEAEVRVARITESAAGE